MPCSPCLETPQKPARLGSKYEVDRWLGRRRKLNFGASRASCSHQSKKSFCGRQLKTPLNIPGLSMSLGYQFHTAFFYCSSGKPAEWKASLWCSLKLPQKGTLTRGMQTGVCLFEGSSCQVGLKREPKAKALFLGTPFLTHTQTGFLVVIGHEAVGLPFSMIGHTNFPNSKCASLVLKMPHAKSL